MREIREPNRYFGETYREHLDRLLIRIVLFLFFYTAEPY